MPDSKNSSDEIGNLPESSAALPFIIITESLLYKFRERFSNGAVTGPPHKQNKTICNIKLVSDLLL